MNIIRYGTLSYWLPCKISRLGVFGNAGINCGQWFSFPNILRLCSNILNSNSDHQTYNVCMLYNNKLKKYKKSLKKNQNSYKVFRYQSNQWQTKGVIFIACVSQYVDGHFVSVGVQLLHRETLLQEKNPLVVDGSRTRVLEDSMAIAASAPNHCTTETICILFSKQQVLI